MYTLQVFYSGSRLAAQTYEIEKSARVLTRIPELLAAHDGCERIAVSTRGVRMFPVNCHGNRLAE